MPQPQVEYERIELNLTLHSPQAPVVFEVMDELRRAFKAVAHLVDSSVPVGREKSMALTSIEDACMYAIAGVARHQTEVIEAESTDT